MEPFVPDFAPKFKSSLDFLIINETFYSYKLPDVMVFLPNDEYEILVRGARYADVIDG
jgi:hypothetical protein